MNIDFTRFAGGGFGGGSSSVEMLFTTTAANGVLKLQQYRANFSRRGGLGSREPTASTRWFDHVCRLYPEPLA